MVAAVCGPVAVAGAVAVASAAASLAWRSRLARISTTTPMISAIASNGVAPWSPCQKPLNTGPEAISRQAAMITPVQPSQFSRESGGSPDSSMRPSSRGVMTAVAT